MSVFLYLVLGIVALAFLWIKRRYNFWAERGFLSPQSSFPFGSLKGVGSKLTACETIDVIYKQFKGKAPAVGIYFFVEPTILPLDPELYKNILVRDFSSFHDRGFYYNKEDEPTSAK
jgi:cytochrome P450 family 6